MESSIDYDHKIIVIDSDTATFPDSSVCDFYIDLDEPFRNVYKIKIITILLNTFNSNTDPVNKNLESVYIDLNNYTRLISKSSNKKDNIYYFDSLIIETANINNNGTSTIKNDYNNADIEYLLNPIELQLKRFRIRLLDNSNNLIAKTAEGFFRRFVMKISVYYNNKKTNRL